MNFNLDINERQRVRTLAAMNRAIYPASNYTKSLHQLSDIYEAGVNILGGKGTTAEERARHETALGVEWTNTFRGSFLHNSSLGSNFSRLFEPNIQEAE